jgi:hypothetical protein
VQPLAQLTGRSGVGRVHPDDQRGERVRVPGRGRVERGEHRPQRLDVGDRIRGGVETPTRPDRRRARPDRGGRGHRQVRRAHLPLQRRAAQRPRPGAALIEHHQPVPVERRAETVHQSRDERHARLAGAAGQEEEHAARADATPDTATRSDSRPGAEPNGSSRTRSDPQLNPAIPGHGRAARTHSSCGDMRPYRGCRQAQAGARADPDPA